MALVELHVLEMAMIPTVESYQLFILKRLAQLSDRHPAALRDEVDHARDLLTRHAHEKFDEVSQLNLALAALNQAVLDIEHAIDDPDFNAPNEIEAIESNRAARRSNPPQEPLPPQPALSKPAAPTQQPVTAGAARPRPAETVRKPRLWPVAILAAAVGGVAGAAVMWALAPSGGVSRDPIVGAWQWAGGARVELARDGSFTFNGRPAGHYFATSDRHFILIHANGRFVDYVTLDATAGRLVGVSAAGAEVNATRLR
jgi:hypothetical protein